MITKQAFFELRNFIFFLDRPGIECVIKNYKDHFFDGRWVNIKLSNHYVVEISDYSHYQWYDDKRKRHREGDLHAIKTTFGRKYYYVHGELIKIEN